MHIIETHIDDVRMEYLGSDFQDALLANGATDFFYTHVQMKKGRPGINLTVLAAEDNLNRVSEFILEHTSTIGLRHYPVQRSELARTQYEVDSPYGPFKVKEVTKPSGRKSRKIEYESLKQLSQEQGIPIRQLELELYSLLHL